VIRIRRPKRVPAVLAKDGAAQRKAHCGAFAKGATEFTFDGGIYGHPTVKKTLIKAQHDKCCFCESRVTHIASGHIEHFRPKGGVRQRKQDPLKKPGYFWLAYEWTNLLFCCEICNSRFKKNLFPLSDPKARARKPTDNLDAERPVFLNPADEDPTLHIGFREEYPFAVNASSRGETTWRELGLDREELAEMRRDHLVVVKALKKVRDGRYPAADRAQAAALLTRWSSARGQWSAMVVAALEGS
jgi:uncharacterized protein (TIGR02646 family)